MFFIYGYKNSSDKFTCQSFFTNTWTVSMVMAKKQTTPGTVHHSRHTRADKREEKSRPTPVPEKK